MCESAKFEALLFAKVSIEGPRNAKNTGVDNYNVFQGRKPSCNKIGPVPPLAFSQAEAKAIGFGQWDPTLSLPEKVRTYFTNMVISI